MSAQLMGRRKPANPIPGHSTTPGPNPFKPFNPTQPVKAEPGAPPTFSVGEGIFFPTAHMGTPRLISSFLRWGTS